MCVCVSEWSDSRDYSVCVCQCVCVCACVRVCVCASVKHGVCGMWPSTVPPGSLSVAAVRRSR